MSSFQNPVHLLEMGREKKQRQTTDSVQTAATFTLILLQLIAYVLPGFMNARSGPCLYLDYSILLNLFTRDTDTNEKEREGGWNSAVPYCSQIVVVLWALGILQYKN